MAYVPVPKDLNAVKTKVMFNLTKRQLICFGGGALIGVPLFAVIIEMVRRWLEARLAAKGEPTDTLYYYPKNALSNAERDLYYEHAGIRYRYEHSKLKTRVDKLLERFSGKSKTPPAGADTEDTKKDNRGNTEENGQDS